MTQGDGVLDPFLSALAQVLDGAAAIARDAPDAVGIGRVAELVRSVETTGGGEPGGSVVLT